jgi:hypothetical protein
MQMLSEVISFSNRGHERKRFFPLCIVPCLALSLRLPNPQLLDYQNAQMAAYLSSLRKHP